MKHVLPKLPFAYNALEPHFDEQTMTIHHTKHHQAYVDNLNAALEKHPELPEMDLKMVAQLVDKMPADIQNAVRNNGGGHFNHTFFWNILKKNENGRPVGNVASAINTTWGSFDAFKEAFATAAKTRFGSGWAWLIVGKNRNLEVVSTPNQDPVLPMGTPILGLDVWEHAYYLKYQNKRPDYINAFFHVIDWDKVEALYNQALAGK
jgi:superoxide dismutase, Fe-Mn family